MVSDSRPQTCLSLLSTEPEDLEDLYIKYKVMVMDVVKLLNFNVFEGASCVRVRVCVSTSTVLCV